MEYSVYLTFETINYSKEGYEGCHFANKKKKLEVLYILYCVLHYLFQMFGISSIFLVTHADL